MQPLTEGEPRLFLLSDIPSVCSFVGVWEPPLCPRRSLPHSLP